MRLLLLVSLAFATFSCKAQSEREITTELHYFPEQQADVSDETFRRWTLVLKNVYEENERDSGEISYAGHVNIATAIMSLKGPKQKVLDQFYLAQQKNLLSTAQLFPMVYKSYDRVEGYLSQSEYDSMINKFQVFVANNVKEEIDPEAYAKEGGYNVELVKLMASLIEKDQEYRISDLDRQQLIDQNNIRTIDSLFQVHKTYIGKTLVGKKYQAVMHLIIQHADLEHQEKYLPIVHQAVKDNEVFASSLKLLIDRIYSKKDGHQIFGTQSGRDLANDSTIQEVKNKYGM